jgi:membrane-anchored protein YejM (alkaline phosphatase superfamily)
VAAWTSRDISSRLIVDSLTPAATADAGLYEFLQLNTNIPRSTRIEPVDVSFAPLAARSGQKPPHIFVFVVDSLRRDYLSPYNDAVRFTPAIQRFAEESTVFERAFTRYGGTGLAVPSIWVGGLVLHKQYVTPFAPMNTLDKLLDAEGYSRAISMEHIVETVLPAGVAVEPLDAGRPVKDHRLCDTLQDVRGRLDALRTSDRPGFFYSLPQDIHISTLTREGGAAIDTRGYDGFNAAYASRVGRLDACFGEFIGDLKARGLYDDSIVILTSDHGDSLGEQGRMGHAYTIFPEVVQVPLLVHLPASLRATYAANPSALAFTSDLAPSLYALLGHEPTRPAPIFGRPLFARGAPPAGDRTGPEVIASSYGSVYGALLDGGRRLYIIDAVSFQEHAYELDGTAAGRIVSVSGRDREVGQRAVRRAIEQLSTFYGYAPPGAPADPSSIEGS